MEDDMTVFCSICKTEILPKDVYRVLADGESKPVHKSCVLNKTFKDDDTHTE